MDTRPVAAIKIGERHRKDMGDLGELARSIDAVGLLHPIVITPDNTLIAGERRLRAWDKSKYAGQPIPVRVINLDNIASGEFEENEARKGFTPSEMVNIKRALEPKLKEEAKARHDANLKQNRTERGNSPFGEMGRADDKIAQFVGRDRRQIQMAEAVVAAAEQNPQYEELVKEMDKTGRIHPVHAKLPHELKRGGQKNRQITPSRVTKQSKRAPMHIGRKLREKYSIIVVEEIKPDLSERLAELAREDCSLWIWLTKIELAQAISVAQRLHFWPQKIVVWIERRGEKRFKVDRCFVATRGSPPFRDAKDVIESRADNRKTFYRPLEFVHYLDEVTTGREVLQCYGEPPSSGWDYLDDSSGEPSKTLSVARA
jgi:ParB-like chromosome segregation protein Spo0J